MILRLLNVQGIAGIAVGLALAILLVVQKGETRHWQKAERRLRAALSRRSRRRFAGTVANYRAAADAGARRRPGQCRARRRRAATQSTKGPPMNFEARLAAARARC